MSVGWHGWRGLDLGVHLAEQFVFAGETAGGELGVNRLVAHANLKSASTSGDQGYFGKLILVLVQDFLRQTGGSG